MAVAKVSHISASTSAKKNMIMFKQLSGLAGQGVFPCPPLFLACSLELLLSLLSVTCFKLWGSCHILMHSQQLLLALLEGMRSVRALETWKLSLFCFGTGN